MSFFCGPKAKKKTAVLILIPGLFDRDQSKVRILDGQAENSIRDGGIRFGVKFKSQTCLLRNSKNIIITQHVLVKNGDRSLSEWSPVGCSSVGRGVVHRYLDDQVLLVHCN